MTQYARFETRTADLATQFGYDLAVKWFGQDIVDELPKFVRGKHKGKPKGIYEWTKVVEGGWIKAQGLPNGGYVENRRGSIIERKLCERISTRGGVYGGKTLHRLGQGETVASRAENYKVEELKTLAKDIVEVEAEIVRLDKSLKQFHEGLTTIDDDKRELLVSVIEDYEADRETQVVYLDLQKAKFGEKTFTPEVYTKAIEYYEGELEYFGDRVDMSTVKAIIKFLEERK